LGFFGPPPNGFLLLTKDGCFNLSPPDAPSELSSLINRLDDFNVRFHLAPVYMQDINPNED